MIKLVFLINQFKAEVGLVTGPGLPDFSWYNIQKKQMTTKYTKWP
jgi:hypothetical protein